MAALVRMPGACWTAREARRMRINRDCSNCSYVLQRTYRNGGAYGAGNWIGCGQPDPADNDG